MLFPGDTCIKLDQIAERGYSIGYIETSYAYRIFILGTKRIIFKRDVMFMEDKAFIRSRDFSLDDQCGQPTKATRPT